MYKDVVKGQKVIKMSLILGTLRLPGASERVHRDSDGAGAVRPEACAALLAPRGRRLDRGGLVRDQNSRQVNFYT